MVELSVKEKAMGFKLFRARNGEEKRLTHPQGHIQIIGQEYVPVHPMFHADAYGSGCASSDMFEPGGGFVQEKTGSGPEVLSAEARKEKIIEAIGKMAESGDATLFTAAGIPNTNVISQMVGFTVSAAERDAIYTEMIATGE